MTNNPPHAPAPKPSYLLGVSDAWAVGAVRTTRRSSFRCDCQSDPSDRTHRRRRSSHRIRVLMLLRFQCSVALSHGLIEAACMFTRHDLRPDIPWHHTTASLKSDVPSIRYRITSASESAPSHPRRRKDCHSKQNGLSHEYGSIGRSNRPAAIAVPKLPTRFLQQRPKRTQQSYRQLVRLHLRHRRSQQPQGL